MSKKTKTYVNLVGSNTSPSRKRKLTAKKGRRSNAVTRTKSRGSSRTSR